jgi:hypothetical protein
MKWIRVIEHQGAEEYVDLDKVVRIVFTVSGETKNFDSAQLVGISGSGFIILGTVRGDVTLKKLHDHVSGAGKEFLHA